MNYLLNLYYKSTNMVVAHKLFDTTALSNLVCWNTMICGFDHNQMFEKSLEMFCGMHLIGVEPMSLVMRVFFRLAIFASSNILQTSLFTCYENGFISSGYV